MSNNPSEELKKLEQQLLAVEDEPEALLPEAEPQEEDDAILFPDEEELAAEEDPAGEPAAEAPFVERDEEFEAFYQDILREFGPDTKPRRKTSSTRKTVHQNAYSDREPAPRKEKSVRGLVITLCLEMLGIAGVVLWWVLRIL